MSSPSSSVPGRPEKNVASAAPAATAASTTFHVLNSGVGGAGAFARPPHAAAASAAAALRSPQMMRPITTGYGYPPAAMAAAHRAPGVGQGQLGAARMEIVQQLMHLAGWGTLPSPPSPSPWLHNHNHNHNYAAAAFMSSSPRPRAHQQPLLLPPSPSPRPPAGPIIRAPPPPPSPSFASGPTAGAASGGSSVAVVARRRYGGPSTGGGGAGRRKPANVRPLQITDAATAAGSSSASASKKKTPPATATTNGAVQRLPPVLAMPTTTAGGEVAAAANGRVRKKRAPKNKDMDMDMDSSSSKPEPSCKKPRQRAAAGKQRQRTARDKDTVNATDADADAIVVVENQQPPSNDLQIVPVLPAPTPINRRKRKPNAVAAATTTPSSSATGPGRCNVVARRSSAITTAAAATVAAKRHSILTWMIDGGFLTDGEKVFYVPADGGGEGNKVVSGAVTTAGVHCGCCDAVLPLPAFEAHAAGGEKQQKERGRAWERILLVSGSSLLSRVREAWEKERVRMFLVQEKARAALEQEQAKSVQAKRRLLAKHKKEGRGGVIMSPARIRTTKLMVRSSAAGGEKDSSDDACGVCADGGELLCCDTCTSTFHPACLALKVPEGSWACHYCRCVLCMANDDQGLSTCQHCTLKYHEICRPSLSNGRRIGAYCSETCKKVSAQLSDIIGVANQTEDGFSWALLKIQKDEPVSSQNSAVVLECNVKLAVALGVLNECFNPVKDRRTKIDMLHQAVYSLRSEFKRVSYEGFYTMVLEKDGEIISAALLRIHGTKVAEMPFAGTLPAYRKQGMMRRLVNAVEQVLASVGVEKLVIPAIAALVDTWKRSFSFRPLDDDPEAREESRRRSLVVITGTTLLHKPVVAGAATAPSSPAPKQLEAAPPAAAKTAAEPWWWKYTYGAPPLTNDERAFLETDARTAAPLGCSFTDLVITAGKVAPSSSSLHQHHKALTMCAGNSSPSTVPCGSSGSPAAAPGAPRLSFVR